MTPGKKDKRSPAERLEDRVLILAEMQRAVHQAVLDHKRAGNPIAVWRDGRVVWIPAEQIPER